MKREIARKKWFRFVWFNCIKFMNANTTKMNSIQIAFVLLIYQALEETTFNKQNINSSMISIFS